MCSDTQNVFARYGTRWLIRDLTVATPLFLILIQFNPVYKEKWSMEQLVEVLKGGQSRKFYNLQ
jgi:hypothetical protein